MWIMNTKILGGDLDTREKQPAEAAEVRKLLDIDEKQGRQLYSKSCPNSLRNSLDSKDFEGAGEDSIEASVAVASQVQQVSVASIIESQIKFDENNKPTMTLEAETTSIESKQSPRVIPVLKIRLVHNYNHVWAELNIFLFIEFLKWLNI